MKMKEKAVGEISVILCTHNRCQSLASALDSVAGSVMPESVAWEVLVVDNNSSDRTREVVEDFCRQYPGRFRYLFEPQPGKSYALNAGVRESRGEILAFMDDDVTVEPTWLQNLTSSLQTSEFAGAGGRVLRKWTCPPPRWLSIGASCERMAWPLVIFDLGSEVGEIQGNPCGTNMAFRREIFVKYGDFRTDLGPQLGNAIRCEDSEFGQRLTAAGERLRYEPSAIVYHPVTQDRLTKEYFLAWWFDFGRGGVRMALVRPPVWGIPWHYFYMARTTARLLGNTLGWILALKPYRRFLHKILVWETAGTIREGYIRWFGPKRQTPSPAGTVRTADLAKK